MVGEWIVLVRKSCRWVVLGRVGDAVVCSDNNACRRHGCHFGINGPAFSISKEASITRCAICHRAFCRLWQKSIVRSSNGYTARRFCWACQLNCSRRPNARCRWPNIPRAPMAYERRINDFSGDVFWWWARDELTPLGMIIDMRPRVRTLDV